MVKQYPSIDGPPRFGSSVYVYPKYDGSNIRAEWTRKKWFDKFGSRKVLLGADNEQLGGAIALIKAREDEFAVAFRDKRFSRIDKAVCFFEYWGHQSFAGLHQPGDAMRVSLIDLDIYKRGQIDPRDFNDFALMIDGAAPVLDSRFNQPAADLVRAGTYPGQTFEGVICKLPPERPWQPPYMFKMKSQAWIDKVKALYGAKAQELL